MNRQQKILRTVAGCRTVEEAAARLQDTGEDATATTHFVYIGDQECVFPTMAQNKESWDYHRR